MLFCTDVPVDYFDSDLSFRGSEDQEILFLLFLLYPTDIGFISVTEAMMIPKNICWHKSFREF